MAAAAVDPRLSSWQKAVLAQALATPAVPELVRRYHAPRIFDRCAIHDVCAYMQTHGIARVCSWHDLHVLGESYQEEPVVALDLVANRATYGQTRQLAVFDAVHTFMQMRRQRSLRVPKMVIFTIAALTTPRFCSRLVNTPAPGSAAAEKLSPRASPTIRVKCLIRFIGAILFQVKFRVNLGLLMIEPSPALISHSTSNLG